MHVTTAQRKQYFLLRSSLSSVHDSIHMHPHALHTPHYTHTFHTCAHTYTHSTSHSWVIKKLYTHTHTHTHTQTLTCTHTATYLMPLWLSWHHSCSVRLLQNQRSSSLHLQTLLTALRERKLCVYAVGCAFQYSGNGNVGHFCLLDDT